MTAENLAMTVVGPTEAPWSLGKQYTRRAYFTVGSAVETGDSWTASNFLPSQDVQIISGMVFGADLDTNASPQATVIVGDGTDTDGYLSSKTAGGGEQNNVLPFDGALISTYGTPPASRNLTLTLGGTVATAASSGTVWVEATYLCINADRVS